MPTEWTLTHGNGSTDRFYPSDSRYAQYVIGNGVCEDLRSCDDHFDGPHCGIFWYGGFIDEWYGSSLAPFLFENLIDPLGIVTYPWTFDALLHRNIEGDCDPGTDCTDCSASPPPSPPPPLPPPRCDEGCAQAVHTNWSLLRHDTGDVEAFLPSDPQYVEYVSGNGVCEDIRNGDFLHDPYGGLHFYEQKPDDVSHTMWYDDDATYMTSYNPSKNVTITYPWTAHDIFSGNLAGAQCIAGTDCADCATSPPSPP